MAMDKIRGKSLLVCFLLIVTGISAANLDDAMDAAKDVAKDMAGKAQDAAGQAVDMAKQILDNTGFDVKDLPQNLMQTASMLFQMAANASGPFTQLLKAVQGKLEGNVSMEDVKKDYNELLTNAEFVEESQNLMTKHNNNPNDPGFKEDMEKLLVKYLQDDGGAGGLEASVLAVVLAVVVYMELL